MSDRISRIIKASISTENKYCEGVFSSRNNNTYILGINFGLGKTRKKRIHEETSELDKIIAFDRAEIAGANIGQINMMTVSSFCGCKGLIWGYDICKADLQPAGWNLSAPGAGDHDISIYTIDPLKNAFIKLTGTVEKPVFPFLPGAHVPCACKALMRDTPGIIYAALGIGIPEHRDVNACLLMEDVGTIPLNVKEIDVSKQQIQELLVQSLLTVGRNQGVIYKDIFVGLETLEVEEDEVGCALVAAPYFTIAGNAVPESPCLWDMTIQEWEHYAGSCQSIEQEDI